MKSILIALALIGLSLGASTTNVNLKYILRCEGQETFDYTVKIYESDMLKDDLIAEQNGSGKWKTQGNLSGTDNGDGDSDFEFYAYITHNCGGEGFKKVPLEPNCRVGQVRCDYSLDLLL